MKALPLYLFLSFGLLSCGEEHKEKEIHPLDQVKKNLPTLEGEKNLYQLSWMEGLWVDSVSFPGNIVVENWRLIEDTLVGNRGTIKGTDTTYAQVSKIFINNGKPVYLLEPEGASFVSFNAIAFSKDSVTFSNAANLAPTKLTYKNQNQDLGLSFTIITQVGERTFHHLFSK